MLFEELPVKDFKMQLPRQKGTNLWRVKKFKYKEMKYIPLFWMS